MDNGQRYLVVVIALCLCLCSAWINAVEGSNRHEIASTLGVRQLQITRDWRKQMLVAVNRERVKAGLKPLCMNYKLNNAAQSFSQQLVTQDIQGQYALVYSNRDSIFSRLSRAGYDWESRVGMFTWYAENIAYNYRDVNAVMTAWMNSEDHVRRILGSGATMVGFGVQTSGDNISWVQVFSASSSEKCDEPATAPTTTPPPTTAPPTTQLPTSAPVFATWQQRMLARVNEKRAQAGLKPLCMNQKLTQAAEWTSDYLVHVGVIRGYILDANNTATRISRAGYVADSYRENICLYDHDEILNNVDEVMADYYIHGDIEYDHHNAVEGVMTHWMNSTFHRANILDSTVTMVGFSQQERYFGTTLWVQIFASSSREKCDPPITAPPTTAPPKTPPPATSPPTTPPPTTAPPTTNPPTTSPPTTPPPTTSPPTTPPPTTAPPTTNPPTTSPPTTPPPTTSPPTTPPPTTAPPTTNPPTTAPPTTSPPTTHPPTTAPPTTSPPTTQLPTTAWQEIMLSIMHVPWSMFRD